MQNYVFIIIFLFSASESITIKTPDQIRNEQGKLMQSQMSNSMNPCSNFYKYACGRWAESYRLEGGEVFFGASDVLTNKVNKFFKDAVLFNNLTSTLNANLQILLETSEVQRIKHYYELCRLQKGLKYEPYIKTLNFPGGWPALNRTWREQHFDWLNMTAQLKLFNIEALLDVTVAPHYQNATRNALYISPAKFRFFPPSSYLGERNPVVQKTMSAEIKFAFKGLGIKKRKIVRITESILEFKTALARIITDFRSATEDNDSYNLNLEELGILFPKIDFQRYLKIVTGKKYPKTQEVILLSRSYFWRLMELLNKTKSEVLANYLFFKFTSVIGNSNGNDQHCTEEIINYFGFALSPIYSMVFNNERDNEDVQSIGANIKEEFSKIIENATWIDQNTKEEASAKVKNVIMTVGGSSSFDAYQSVRKELFNIDMDLTSYYKSKFQIIAHTIRKKFKELETLNKNNDTNANTAKVNAFYDSTRNHILIPTSILQTPTYHYNLPYSVKYGALGYVIGHEITHGLDTTGAGFDSNGAVRDWWSESASAEYAKRSKCIAQQYGSFTSKVKNTSVKSIKTNTLDEDIADNGGLRLSYLAYQNWLKANPDKTETLPHVNLTNNQLFFLSFAQYFCQNISPVGMFLTLITDEHGLNEHRVIGALRNFKNFSEDFNCPVGSNMNPAKKCRVW